MIPYKHVVICGGSGKRLWPLSRNNFPKPYLSINNQPSLFQQTLRRHSDCTGHVIITNETLYYQSKYQVETIGLSHKSTYLLESVGKNTGPAILLGALQANDDELLVVTPADHLISPTSQYQADIQSACQLAMNDNIVLIGIQPTMASTEYGYIKTNKNVVVGFKEKPNQIIAKQFFNDENYLWNSGIFCFKASTLKNCFNAIEPKLFAQIKQAYAKKSATNVVDLSSINAMSFDRGVLENTDQLNVIRSTFNWSDLGCFDEIEKISPNNSNEIRLNATNTFSISTSDKTIAFHDVDDIYLIESNDAILVGKKTQSKNVSGVVKILEQNQPEIVKQSNIVYRPWGYYMILHEQSQYKIKKIVIYPHCRLSLQTHQHRSEHWTCVEGRVNIINNTIKKTLRLNESIYIEKGNKHRIENNDDISASVIEVQYGDYLGEDDIVRIESDY